MKGKEMKRFENWADELRYRVGRIGNDGQGEDEKGAGGVYDMAQDITEMVYEILVKNNDKGEVDKLYYPDTEIECAIYDAIKYGKGVE